MQEQHLMRLRHYCEAAKSKVVDPKLVSATGLSELRQLTHRYFGHYLGTVALRR